MTVKDLLENLKDFEKDGYGNYKVLVNYKPLTNKDSFSRDSNEKEIYLNTNT